MPAELLDTPFFKKVKRVDPMNYRHVVTATNLENQVSKRMYSCQATRYKYQSELRIIYSINLFLSSLTNDVLKNFDEGLLNGMF